jgi:hypothetical protein
MRASAGRPDPRLGPRSLVRCRAGGVCAYLPAQRAWRRGLARMDPASAGISRSASRLSSQRHGRPPQTPPRRPHHFTHLPMSAYLMEGSRSRTVRYGLGVFRLAPSLGKHIRCGHGLDVNHRAALPHQLTGVLRSPTRVSASVTDPSGRPRTRAVCGRPRGAGAVSRRGVPRPTRWCVEGRDAGGCLARGVHSGQRSGFTTRPGLLTGSGTLR